MVVFDPRLTAASDKIEALEAQLTAKDAEIERLQAENMRYLVASGNRTKEIDRKEQVIEMLEDKVRRLRRGEKGV